ncbi:peptidase M14 [Pseudomassariella vexata]|uniref:Peptidase M14 n=1 Tax=Pseudomassariella vexata TaxID=1141098 RepID=A0A1Y2E6R4_9PEZI|nr:peptidase M14 [Pseudomassariella vexata]ORY67248.1 peptidase M14 [Pseudomassariella vexata]
MKCLSAWSIVSLLASSRACLLPEETGRGPLRAVRRQFTNNSGIPVGPGDRFNGGTIAPRGLGTQKPDTNLGSLLNVQEIKSALDGLANQYGFDTFTTPYMTYENASIFGAKIGGRRKSKHGPRVFFNAAIHARERGSSDNLLYFISDLLYANKHKTGLTYGGRTYSSCEVGKALSTGIVFVPLSNPDGVAYDQATNSCWRKNRNPAAATPGDPTSVGIDLNRNFDFLWDFPNLFEPSVGPNAASSDPRAQDYHGTSAFSEPETKSIKWVMHIFSDISWYVDIHSFAGVILYSWGSDENQSRNPGMNFMNSSYGDVRGLMPDKPEEGIMYSEYTPNKDWAENIYTAMKIGHAMDATIGRHYEVTQAAYLYPTSGASDDYSYSRHFINPSLNKIHGFTVEFGFGNEDASCPFYPTLEQYHQNILETSAGFMELLLSAADAELGKNTCH